MKEKRETVGLFSNQLMFLLVLTSLRVVLATLSPTSTPVTTRVEDNGNVVDASEIANPDIDQGNILRKSSPENTPTHLTETKGIVERLNKLENIVLGINNRVKDQEIDIVSFKSILMNQEQNQRNEKERFDLRLPRSADPLNDNSNVEFDGLYPKNREKREILYSPPPCYIKQCAFDISDNEKRNTSKTKNISTTIVKRPASCEDLKAIGHLLSGFYLIQPNQSDTTNFNNKIRIVYCDFSLKKFQLSKNLTGGITENIGYINTESLFRGVKFCVQRNMSLPGEEEAAINFQVERLNIGGGMNLETGIFTALVSGTYYFAFSAVKGRSTDSGSEAKLYLNGKSVAKSYATAQPLATMSLHSTLELKSGDKVSLRKGPGDEINDSPDSSTQFTGWLIEEGFN